MIIVYWTKEHRSSSILKSSDYFLLHSTQYEHVIAQIDTIDTGLHYVYIFCNVPSVKDIVFSSLTEAFSFLKNNIDKQYFIADEKQMNLL